MKFSIVTGIAALALALNAGMAFAQSGSQPRIGDGSNSGPAPAPYSGGTANAQIGDGSNSGPAPAPYSSGTGSAQKSPTSKYGQGNAQSEVPSSVQYDPSGANGQKGKSQ